jgi:hypothetical protein
MAVTDNNGVSNHCQGRHRKQADPWHLGKPERAAISAVAGLVAIACALGQYIKLNGKDSIGSFGISLGISVAGGLIVILLVRLFMIRKRRITILPLSALAVLAAAGIAGVVVGHFIFGPVRADHWKVDHRSVASARAPYLPADGAGARPGGR